VAANKHSDLTIFRRIILLARPYWVHLSAIFFLRLLAAPLALLLPLPLKIIVDSVIGTDPLPVFVKFFIPESFAHSSFALLILAVCMQVLVVLFIHLQSAGNYVLQNYTGERLTLDLREHLFRHVQRLSFLFHDSRGTADSIYRIQNDAPKINNLTIHGVIPLISAALTLILMLYVTALINMQLALVAMAICPFLYITCQTYSLRMRPKYKDLKKMESHALKIIQEVLTAVRIVKAFGQEESEKERFSRHSKNTVDARVRLSLAEGLFGLLVNLAIAVGTALVLFIGVRNVQAGVLSLGELLMVIAYLAQLYDPLKTISKQIAKLQDSLASAHRAFELMDEIPEVRERPNAKSIKRARGDFEIQDVSFSYKGDFAILKDISFQVKSGTRMGIVGKTGAGKTTLVSLLTRFYDPQSGNILLDGTDLRDFKIADLQNQFSIVLQDPVLFSTSIEENIAYARPQATEEQIVEAAKAADAHNFIVNLPEGYNTPVGERGMRLSGGERQRIALARAYLKDAPILILDEPSSSVDVRTEARIIETMEKLMEGRTVFMIAHRLSTLENCDVLMEIEEGRQVPVRSDISKPTREEKVPGKRDLVDSISGRKKDG